MNVELSEAEPAQLECDLLAVAVGGARLRELDLLFGGRLARAAEDADPVAVVHAAGELRARPVAAIGRGASGYGVRMLVELARRLADTPGDSPAA